MKRAMILQRSLVAAVLAAGLTAPLAMADDHAKVYYDKAHKDRHTWDGNEEKSYAAFRSERHIPEHSFARAKKSEQADYWAWRHDHPDHR